MVCRCSVLQEAWRREPLSAASPSQVCTPVRRGAAAYGCEQTLKTSCCAWCEDMHCMMDESLQRATGSGLRGPVCWLAGGHKWRTQREALDEGVDLVVATPGRLAEHIKGGTLKLAQCQAVVLDEADVLLGDAFAFAQQARPRPGAVCSHLLSEQHSHAGLMQAMAANWTAQEVRGKHTELAQRRRPVRVSTPNIPARFSNRAVMLATALSPACTGGPGHTACDPVLVTGY